MPDDATTALRREVRHGLTSRPRRLPPQWLYAATGSSPFPEVTRLPEHCPTRAERAILTHSCPDIASLTGARTLIECGFTSSAKTHLLVGALRDHGTLCHHMYVGASRSPVDEADRALTAAFSGLEVHAAVADFTTMPELPPGPRLLAFLGGGFGNLLPSERSALLTGARTALDPGDTLLLGVRLVKDPTAIVAAYNDADGGTGRFNRSVLARLSRELGADVDLDSFEHVVVWDIGHERIEVRLRSRREQSVTFHGLGGALVHFGAGEDLRTALSATFRPEGLADELAGSGLELTHWWTDPDRLYGVALAALDDVLRPSRSGQVSAGDTRPPRAEEPLGGGW